MAISDVGEPAAEETALACGRTNILLARARAGQKVNAPRRGKRGDPALWQCFQRREVADELSNGVQKGPPIGVEEGPPFQII